ncbi:hypothetical protein, partial [Limnospira fusiformis]|uniref:hypothetical protein n=1 Tax=Limnospira fusiformis TaxID=54297 RepID=UPI0034E0A3D8
YGEIKFLVENSDKSKFTFKVLNYGDYPVFIPNMNISHLLEFGFFGGYNLNIESKNREYHNFIGRRRPPNPRLDDFTLLQTDDFIEFTIDLADVKFYSMKNGNMTLHDFISSEGYNLTLYLSVGPEVDFLPNSKKLLSEMFMGLIKITVSYDGTAGNLVESP